MIGIALELLAGVGLAHTQINTEFMSEQTPSHNGLTVLSPTTEDLAVRLRVPRQAIHHQALAVLHLVRVHHQALAALHLVRVRHRAQVAALHPVRVHRRAQVAPLPRVLGEVAPILKVGYRHAYIQQE